MSELLWSAWLLHAVRAGRVLRCVAVGQTARVREQVLSKETDNYSGPHLYVDTITWTVNMQSNWGVGVGQELVGGPANFPFNGYWVRTSE